MPTARVLDGVLHDLLHGLASRYTSYDGYWLFGFLVRDAGARRFDLLADPPAGDDPWSVLHRIALRRFDEGLRASGLDRSAVAEATLRVERLSEETRDRVGHVLLLEATARASTGRTFERRRRVFAAPHDPSRELSSTRPDE